MRRWATVLIGTMFAIGIAAGSVSAGSKDCTVTSVKGNMIMLECGKKKAAKLQVGDTLKVNVKKSKVQKDDEGC